MTIIIGIVIGVLLWNAVTLICDLIFEDKDKVILIGGWNYRAYLLCFLLDNTNN